MTGQRIAITGSSGLIGGALSAYLRERGNVVIRLVRRNPAPALEARLPGAAAAPSEVAALAQVLSEADAVVNLAGAGVADRRWSASYKRTLRTSRIDTTRTLVSALALTPHPVRLVSGSAIGVYGERGEEVLTESSAPGRGFLADLTREWEREAARATSHGHSVACARTGLVVSAHGGAFQRLALPARLGMGGPLGSGHQWWSWISLRDEVRALTYLIDNPQITGPVNLVAPRASRQGELAHALGRSLRRPAALRVPERLLDAALGEMAAQITASIRVRPEVLTASGFRWLDGNQDQVLDRLAFDVTGGSRR